MKTLRQRMMNDFESERGLATRMAKLGGYASAAKLKSTVAKEDGEIHNFGGFVKIVNHMYPDDKLELMVNLSKNINPNKQTARHMLEYLSIYKRIEDRNELLEKMRNTVNNDEWAFVYRIDYENEQGKISDHEAIGILKERKFRSYSMEVFSKIVMYYCYESLRDKLMMELLLREIDEKVRNIKNPFCKSSYYARLYLIKNTVSLYNGDVSKIKEDIFMLNHSLSPIRASAYLTMGNAFMLSNYKQSERILLKGLEYSSDRKSTQIEIIKSLNFLYVLNGDFEKFIECEEDDYKLFYHCKQKNYSEANKILANINVEKLSSLEKGFHFYYLGLLHEDEELLYESVFHFNECKENYFKKLPIMRLQETGEKLYKIKALSV